MMRNRTRFVAAPALAAADAVKRLRGRIAQGGGPPPDSHLRRAGSGESHTTAPRRAERGAVGRRGSRLLAVAAASLAIVVLFPSAAWAPFFMPSPSVRVTPNVSVEFEWMTDVSWFGEVAVYDNPDGTGSPLTGVRDNDVIQNPVASNHHTVVIDLVRSPLAPDTGYFFQVTSTDPTGNDPSFSSPTPLPPFFTGAQTIGAVGVEPGTDSAVVSWDANVIGLGRVEILSPAGLGPFDDTNNTTDHSIQLTGLQPATTYEFRVSNRHAVDGDALAHQTGMFTTQSAPPTSTSAQVRKASDDSPVADDTTVAKGTALYDTATLAGTTSDAGGTVSYFWKQVSDDPGTIPAVTATTCTGGTLMSTVDVATGVAPRSSNVAPTESGVYEFWADYSGDAGNTGSSSVCGTETVVVPADPPACPNDPRTILGPINADGSSNFKLGRTIPVKIRVIDCHGTAVDGLAPVVSLAKLGASSGNVNEVASSSSADDGNTMRSTGDGNYQFNLSTKRSQFNAGQDLTAGRYRLTISETTFTADVVAEFDLRQ